jgi:hypothetical protein
MASLFTSIPFRLLQAEKAFITKVHKHAGMRSHYERHRVRPIPTMYMPHATSAPSHQTVCSRYAGLASILHTEEAFISQYQGDKSLQDAYAKSRIQ